MPISPVFPPFDALSLRARLDLAHPTGLNAFHQGGVAKQSYFTILMGNRFTFNSIQGVHRNTCKLSIAGGRGISDDESFFVDSLCEPCYVEVGSAHRRRSIDL